MAAKEPGAPAEIGQNPSGDCYSVIDIRFPGGLTLGRQYSAAAGVQRLNLVVYAVPVFLLAMLLELFYGWHTRRWQDKLRVWVARNSWLQSRACWGLAGCLARWHWMRGRCRTE